MWLRRYILRMQFVFSFKRVYIDGLNIGDEGFSCVSSKGKRALCLEVKQSKVKKQHKRFASLQRQETFQHSHLSFRTKQIALVRRGKNG